MIFLEINILYNLLINYILSFLLNFANIKNIQISNFVLMANLGSISIQSLYLCTLENNKKK
jgi:hypothetical protein